MAIGGVRTLAPCVRDDNRIYGAWTCDGPVRGLNQKVLVYVADGSGGIDPRIQDYFAASQARIIPIVDASLGNNPSAALPRSLRTRLAERTQGFDPAPLIPKILRVAGIVSEGFRIFISYRHDEAAKVGGQLFHALSERMFDPFLDRFSSRSGDDFVALIREELFDKASVLVLETRNIGHSPYCRQEVATAVGYNLGLMAIDLPGSQQTFHAAHRRLDLTNASLGPDGTLSPSDLHCVVNFVEQHYDSEISRRARAQDLTLLQSILAARLRPQPEGVGQYRVSASKGDYVLEITRRPPSLDDFIRTDGRSNLKNPVARGVVFGPISVVRTLRAQQIDWLESKAGIRAIDEGHVMRTLQDIAAGRF